MLYGADTFTCPLWLKCITHTLRVGVSPNVVLQNHHHTPLRLMIWALEAHSRLSLDFTPCSTSLPRRVESVSPFPRLQSAVCQSSTQTTLDPEPLFEPRWALDVIANLEPFFAPRWALNVIATLNISPRSTDARYSHPLLQSILFFIKVNLNPPHWGGTVIDISKLSKYIELKFSEIHRKTCVLVEFNTSLSQMETRWKFREEINSAMNTVDRTDISQTVSPSRQHLPFKYMKYLSSYWYFRWQTKKSPKGSWDYPV